MLTQAVALEERPGEWDALKACEKRLCTMILDKKETGEDLHCPVEKTWPKTTLQGGESKLVKWGFGDARCSVDIRMTRAIMLKALTLPAFSLEIPEHHVKCVVETDGEMKPVDVKLAPRIAFKNGRADKVWINLKDVSGPSSIKTTVWAAANLEDSLGIFHKSMLKAINKFMHKQCPERHGPDAEKIAKAKAERKAKRAAEKAREASGLPPNEIQASHPAAASTPEARPAPELDAPGPATRPSAEIATPAPTPAPAAAVDAAPVTDSDRSSQPAAPPAAPAETKSASPTATAAAKEPSPSPAAPAGTKVPVSTPRTKIAEPKPQVRLQLRTIAPWKLDTAPKDSGE
jgi:hypothetical protein